MVAVASATDSVQLLRAVGASSSMMTAEGVNAPYALFIFPKTRKHLDAVRAEPQLWQGFLMLQHPIFYTQNDVYFVAMCDFGRLAPVFTYMIWDAKIVRVTPGARLCATLWFHVIKIIIVGVVPDVVTPGNRLMIGTGYVAIYA